MYENEKPYKENPHDRIYDELNYMGNKIKKIDRNSEEIDEEIDDLYRKIKGLKEKSKGDKGDKGDKGEDGNRGEQGDKGESGDKGEQGDKGSKGDKGEQGDKGEDGDKGQQGDKGEKGDKGEDGDKGEQGNKGEKGDKGQEGGSPSDEVEVMSTLVTLLGLGVSIVSYGYSHNFCGIGALNHQQTLTNGTIYYLIDDSDYEPLAYCQRQETSILWIETPSGNVYSMPIRVDSTGIHFKPTSNINNLPIGTTFKFSQAVIIVEPEI